jgi:superfamily II DNA or RNA helicase
MGNHVKHLSKKVELEAIIFCHPELFALNGRSIHFQSILPGFLEAGRCPQPEEFLPSLANASIQLTDVPACFGSPPFENLLAWHSYPGSKELGECVQYQFSDGLIITAREIFYHPHSRFVEPTYLPLKNQLRPETLNSPWLHLLARAELPALGDLRTAELSLLSILISASREPKLEVWITSTSDRSLKRPACPLRHIEICPNHPAHWELNSSEGIDRNGQGSASLSLIEDTVSSSGKIFQNFEFNPQQKALYFHSLSQSVELVSLSAYSKLGVGKTYEEWLDLNSKDDTSLKISLLGHSSIQIITQAIDQKLELRGFPKIRRKNFQVIQESQIETQIWIDRGNQIRFCRVFTHQNKRIKIWNLPKPTLMILEGLTSGLGAISHQEPKSIAQDRRGLKRDRDLKVLKHTGLFSLTLLEASTFALHGQTFEGKPLHHINDFLKILFGKLGVLLYEMERKAGFVDFTPTPSVDKLCSKNVIDLIQKFTNQILHPTELEPESIFTEMGEVRIEGGFKSALFLFHAILSKIAVESRGLCFLKPRFNAFSNFLEKDGAPFLHDLAVQSGNRDSIPVESIQTASIVNSWLPESQVLHALLPLHSKGFKIFYDGLPLDEMDTQDFKPVFDLIEPEETPKETGSAIDWFELHPQFFFKGVEIDSNQLDRLTKEGIFEFQGKIYLIQNKNLPSIKRLEAFWSKIQSGRVSMGKRKKTDRFLRLPRNQTLEILALRASGVTVQGGARWKKICRFYDSLNQDRDPIALPNSIRAELKPYQKTGVQWLLDLYQLELGGILADDMGLGKTIQTLSFLDILRSRKEMGPTLIVVPTSLTYNWMSESAKFTPEMPVQIFQSKFKDQASEFLAKNPNSAVICTYGLFIEHQEYFQNIKWNILIFDEAQNLKNITSKRTTSARRISARFKLCLTGTPLENHLGEFYSLLDLVVSGSLGELSGFREKFISPEMIDPTELKYLKLKTRPLVLRRTKSEILSELPPKQESTIKLPFEQKQEKIYRDIALAWNEKVKGSILSEGESKSQLLMLTALLRLRQACSDPGSIPNVKYDVEPPKISVLLEALEEITESGESALVFTQFIHTFDRIKKALQQQEIETYSLHGGTSRPERERILREFQESKKGSVLLMTLKTGGVGLNLIKASYVFHLEPWWNPAVENQATDRAHRIGQQRPVQVYRYLMRESVEEKIEILKERKSAKFNALFSPGTEKESEVVSGSLMLSQTDFEYLLS